MVTYCNTSFVVQVGASTTESKILKEMHSRTHGTFSRIKHTLGPKTHRKDRNTKSMFSNHNAVKLENTFCKAKYLDTLPRGLSRWEFLGMFNLDEFDLLGVKYMHTF